MNQYLLRKIVLLAWLGGLFIVIMSCENKLPQKPKEVARPVKMIKVGKGSEAMTRIYPGQVQASQKVQLAFKVSDKLIDLPVKEGDEVKKGELLARLDPRDFKTELAKIESSIEEAQAILKAMTQGERPEIIKARKSATRGAEANLLEATHDLKRKEKLLKQQIISPSEYDLAKSKYEVAKAEMEAAQENLQQALKGAREEDVLAQKAHTRGLIARKKEVINTLNDTELRAPFDGLVAKVYVDNHQNIQAKQKILSLQDITNLDISVEVSENVIIKSDRKRRKENHLVAVFVAFPEKKFPLTIKEIAGEADPDTKTYEVVATMPVPANMNVMPGMSCNIIHTSKKLYSDKNANEIPGSSVLNDENGSSYVWLVDSKTSRATKCLVKVGRFSGTNLRILDGLNKDDRVIVAGVHYVHEGMLVKELTSKESK